MALQLSQRGYDGQKLHALLGGYTAWQNAGYPVETGQAPVSEAPTPVATPIALTSPDQIERMGPAEARVLMERGDALLYDVRPRAVSEEKHAEGALSLPEEELGNLVASVPQDKQLILYCV